MEGERVGVGDEQLVLRNGILSMSVRTYVTLRATSRGMTIDEGDVTPSVGAALRALLEAGLIVFAGGAYIATDAGEQVVTASLADTGRPDAGGDVIRVEVNAWES